MIVFRAGLIGVLAAALSACSVFEPSRPKFVNATVASVAGNYLQSVIAADEAKIGSYVAWPSLLGAGSEKITKQEFEKQLYSLQNRWTVPEHPIVGLEVLDVDVDGDDGEVEFRKANRSDYPKIKIKLLWVGNGWVITEDNLFGRGDLVEKWQSDPRAFKANS